MLIIKLQETLNVASQTALKLEILKNISIKLEPKDIPQSKKKLFDKIFN